MDVSSLPLPRLLPHVVSDIIASEPSKIWGSIPVNPHTTSDGYEDITYKRFSYAVDRAAWWIRSEFEQSKLRPFEPLAYMGPSDARYIIFTLAAIKAGFQMLFLSPRNSDEAHFAVMNEADCHKWLCGATMKARVESVVSQRLIPKGGNEQVVTIVPEQDELLKDESTPEFPYSKKLEEARWEPLVMLHTSSSTGLPKLIRLTQGYGFHEDVVRHFPAVDGLDVVAGGVILGLLKSLYHDLIMVFQPAAVPLSASLINSILIDGNCTGTVIPPFLVEELMAVPEYFDTLESLKFVQFGSGPLSKYCGDTLLTRQKVAPHYIGSTEVGILPVLQLEDPVQEWQYFHFHPYSGVDLRPVDEEGNLCELFIKKLDAKIPGVQPVFELFPDLDEWSTRDLYVHHPEKPYLWQTHGRADDVIVLSNGEKLNPVDTEARLSNAHPSVTGALVVGQGRFQPAIILELKGIDIDKVNKQTLLDEVWPTIDAANKVAPKHGQLTKSLVLFSSPNKPFLRTPKFSVRRSATVELYKDEINELYRQVESDSDAPDRTDVPENMNLQDLSSVPEFVQQLVGNVTGWSATPASDVDLFMLGMDSLHVVRIVRAIKAALRDDTDGGQIARITSKIIYENPTIQSLTRALSELAKSQASSGTANNSTEGTVELCREQKLQQIIDRWCHGWHAESETVTNGTNGVRESGTEELNHWTVILTGSTGSLGSFILEALISDPRVAKVICLNRSPDAAQQWKQTVLSRKLAPTFNSPDRVQFFRTTDLGADYLGLDKETFQDLLQSVTHVVLNAWPVNFNLSVHSFEKPHIAGVRQFTDFSVHSTKGAKIIFISSISSVTCDADKEPVPEQVLYDNSKPVPMGYGESKYVAERILDAATASTKGRVRTTILRLGQVAGPVVTGSEASGDTRLEPWNSQEWFPSLVISSATLRALPNDLGGMEIIDWIPGNVMGQIVVELMEEANTDGAATSSTVYHLVNPATVRWQQDILPVVQRHLGISEVVSLSQWTDLVESTQDRVDGGGKLNPAAKILPFFQRLARGSEIERAPKLIVDKTRNRSTLLRDVGPVRAEWIRQWLDDLNASLKFR